MLLVIANIPSSRILSTLKMEATLSAETSGLTSATWRHIPEDGILNKTTFLRILHILLELKFIDDGIIIKLLFWILSIGLSFY
jgi:hypothetical protein